MIYNDYFLRTVDYPTLLDLGCKLGVITLHTEGEQVTVNAVIFDDAGALVYSGAYQYLGKLTNSEGAIIVNPEGVPYIHANLRTTADLRTLAMASTDPEVQAALLSLGSFFVTDAEGQAVAPVFPHNVWA